MAPLAITHVLAPAPYGGLETVVEMLARGQAERGDRVTVIGVFSKEPDDHPFWNRLADCAINTIPLVARGRRYADERRAIRKILIGSGCQILHTHGYRPDVLHAQTARRLGIATVSTVHGFVGGGVMNRLYEWMQRRAFRHFDAVVAVSEKLREDLIAGGLSESSVHTIRNAWTAGEDPLSREAARSHLGVSSKGPRIGWVGRLSPEKGPDVMLRSLARLARPDVRLSLIGDGQMREHLLALAEEIGVSSIVDWHHNVPQVAPYLTAFDVLAITSWTEGTPMVLFEAMAAGVPVVTTSVGGIPDVVSDREAFLVDAGDLNGIAEMIERVVAGSPEVRGRIVAARARLDREFASGPWIEQYCAVYRACLES